MRFLWPGFLCALLTLVLDEFFGGRDHCLDLEVGADLFRKFVRQGLIGRDHHSLLNQQTEKVFGCDVELFRQFAGGDHLRENDRAFGFLAVLELNSPGGTRRRSSTLRILASAPGLLARLPSARRSWCRSAWSRSFLLALELLFLELVEKVADFFRVRRCLRLPAGYLAGGFFHLALLLDLALVGQPLADFVRRQLAQALLEGSFRSCRSNPLRSLFLSFVVAPCGELFFGDFDLGLDFDVIVELNLGDRRDLFFDLSFGDLFNRLFNDLRSRLDDFGLGNGRLGDRRLDSGFFGDFLDFGVVDTLFADDFADLFFGVHDLLAAPPRQTVLGRGRGGLLLGLLPAHDHFSGSSLKGFPRDDGSHGRQIEGVLVTGHGHTD